MSLPIYQSFIGDFFPPKPRFTEANLSPLEGKVYIVTGGASGIGFELAKILYSQNATICILGRSEENANQAMGSIKESYPESKGRLRFIYIDLGDLETIKPAAETILNTYPTIDVVFHSAGLMAPPVGTKSKQGIEIQLATHVLGPYLFQHFLTPRLVATARLRPKNAVRVVWITSAASGMSPKGGINWKDINFDETKGIIPKTWFISRLCVYGQSKAGVVILASEYARRYEDNGLISLPANPGYLRSGLQRHAPFLFRLMSKLFYKAYYGAVTYLFAGLSPEVDENKNGTLIVPFGNFGKPRSDLLETTESGPKLWEWCETQCKPFM